MNKLNVDLVDESGEAPAPLDDLAADLPGDAVETAAAAPTVRPGETAALLAPLIDVLCMSVPRLAPVGKDARAMLATAYADVIDKYFPGGPGQWGPELGALLVTAAVIGPCYWAADKPVIEGAPVPAEKVAPPVPEEDVLLNASAPAQPAPPAL